MNQLKSQTLKPFNGRGRFYNFFKLRQQLKEIMINRLLEIMFQFFVSAFLGRLVAKNKQIACGSGEARVGSRTSDTGGSQDLDSIGQTDTLDNSDHDGSNFEDNNHSVSLSMSNISGHSDSTSLVSSRQVVQVVKDRSCVYFVWRVTRVMTMMAHCVCCAIVTNRYVIFLDCVLGEL